MITKKILLDNRDGSLSLISNDTTEYEVPEPGFYKVLSQKSLFFSRQDLVQDKESKLIPESILHKELFDKIRDQFNIKTQQIYSDLNFNHKVGVLLHGKYGCGKTTFCYQIADYFIKFNQAIVIIIQDFDALKFALSFCKEIRNTTEFNKPVVIIFDECEKSMHYEEGAFKAILDSNESLTNCLFLFTTNYIDTVPDAIKNRPSRIKFCEELTGESDETRIYNIFKELNTKLRDTLKLNDIELRNLVSKSLSTRTEKEPTIDDLKHYFIDEISVLKGK